MRKEKQRKEEGLEGGEGGEGGEEGEEGEEGGERKVDGGLARRGGKKDGTDLWPPHPLDMVDLINGSCEIWLIQPVDRGKIGEIYLSIYLIEQTPDSFFILDCAVLL